TCGASTFELVVITKDNHGLLTIASGCTIPLGASPTSLYVNSAGLTNNGTIIVDSGTWDSNASGAATYITNNGTITHNGDGWLSDPGLIMGPSGVVTYAGSTMTVYGVFNVSQGTFPNDLTVTFADDNN